jgi:hypothetical protein
MYVYLAGYIGEAINSTLISTFKVAISGPRPSRGISTSTDLLAT